MRNQSRYGNAAELRTQRLLEAAGYVVAQRRHVGGAGDLLAVRAGEPSRLIECKATNDGPYKTFLPADRRALVETARQAGAIPELAWWKGGKLTWLREDAWPKDPSSLALVA